MKNPTDKELLNRIRELLGKGRIENPNQEGVGGLDAPGKLLENVLG